MVIYVQVQAVKKNVERRDIFSLKKKRNNVCISNSQRLFFKELLPHTLLIGNGQIRLNLLTSLENFRLLNPKQ